MTYVLTHFLSLLPFTSIKNIYIYLILACWIPKITKIKENQTESWSMPLRLPGYMNWRAGLCTLQRHISARWRKWSCHNNTSEWLAKWVTQQSAIKAPPIISLWKQKFLAHNVSHLATIHLCHQMLCYDITCKWSYNYYRHLSSQVT